MYKKTYDNSTFFCFTPLASLVTFLIELFLIIYVIFRYKINKFTQISIAILFFLGMFQLSEYMACKSNDIHIWGKIGAASITLLPILGLHLISLLTRKSRWITVGYVLGLAIFMIIIAYPQFAIDTRCTGKFVILNQSVFPNLLYEIYYFGFILIGLEMLFRSLLLHKGNKTKLLWMIIAYLSFIIPTAIVYTVFAITKNAIPSIMCGFAIIAALIIVFKEIPKFSKAKK